MTPDSRKWTAWTVYDPTAAPLDAYGCGVLPNIYQAKINAECEAASRNKLRREDNTLRLCVPRKLRIEVIE